MDAYARAIDLPGSAYRVGSSWGQGRPETVELFRAARVGGVPCSPGRTSFHPEGHVREARLAEPWVHDGVTWPEGTRVYFSRDSGFQAVKLGAMHFVCGYPFPEGTRFHVRSGFQTELLEAHTLRGVSFAAGSTVCFHKDGTLAWAAPSEPTEVRGVPVRDHLRLHDNDRPMFAVLAGPHAGFDDGDWLGWNRDGELVGAVAGGVELALRNGVVVERREIWRQRTSRGGYHWNHAIRGWGL